MFGTCAKSCSFTALVLTKLVKVSVLAMSEPEDFFSEVITALKETFSDSRNPTPKELQDVTGMELDECKAVLKAYLEATAASEPPKKKKKQPASKPVVQTPAPATPAVDPSLAETMPFPEGFEEELTGLVESPSCDEVVDSTSKEAKEETEPSPADLRRNSFQSAAPTAVEDQASPP